MVTKKLIIDGQVFQTEAKDRGMGRYSICLIQALLKEKYYEVVEVILTDNLSLSKQNIADMSQLFPGAKITKLSLKTTIRTPIEEVFRHNSRVLDEHIVKNSKDNESVDFLIPSPFQEPVASVFPKGVKKLMLFYDLIPFLYHYRYEPVMQYDNYLKRFKYLFEADCIFTISLSIADDLHLYLGIPRKRLVRIDGAPIRTAHNLVIPSHFTIPDKYILMPTSDDPRKNNLRAVLGFEEYLSMYQDCDYKLVITSKIQKRERDHLSLFSKNLIFTGNLHESELNWLYEKCEAVLFVPEIEGLGLPVLEAVEVGKKVVCSTLPVFKEISENAFYFCDHENQQSIASALESALRDNKSIPIKEYKRILNHYNWKSTADRLIKGEEVIKYRKQVNKPRIAMFIPVPNGLSAIGKVVAESHPVMSEYFDIDYFAERGLYEKFVRPNYLKYVANYSFAERFSVEEYSHYDAVVYHIGNGDYHLESIKNGLYLPGYAIIHDTNIKEAFRVLKETGMMLESRVKLEEKLNNLSTKKTSSYQTSLLNNQMGILTHSEYAKQAALSLVDPKTPVESVNLPSNIADLPNYNDNNNLVIGLAGIIADVKGIEIIEAVANNKSFKDCHIKLFGFSYTTQDTLDRLNAYENVIAITNLTDFDFQNSISKLDVFMNYRLSYNGETSLSTIEAMRRGVVVIVRDVGWFSELPDDAVIKVKSQEEAIDKLMHIKRSPDLMKSISSRAKQHIALRFSHEQFAEGLMRLIKEGNGTENLAARLAYRIKSGDVKTIKQYISYIDNNR